MRWPIVLLALAFSVSSGAIMASCGANSTGVFGAGGASASGGATMASGTASGVLTTGSTGTGSILPDSGSCVPKTCQPMDCGPIATGCDGAIVYCEWTGSQETTLNGAQSSYCAAPETCGGGGTSSVCGTGGKCTPKTCLEIGSNCGFNGDGCGGSLQCGTCAAPETCSGTPQVCGTGVACTGLCLQQKKCGGNVTTTVTGTVYAPNGTDPIYNALVYVPNAPVLPFTPGVTCDNCGEPASGSPLVSTYSAVDGTFKLTNVPGGANIPIVIQLGRWRVQSVIPLVTDCQTIPLPETLTHLPQTKAQGDIPLMGFVTGDVDALECVLRKIGIADSEFGDPGSTARVRFYHGDGSGGAIFDANTPGEDQLWGTQAEINQYDMVYFACQGQPFMQAAASQQIVIDYANAGGRVFATHYSYVWLYDDAPFSGTAAWDVDQNPNFSSDPETGYIVTTFPKGVALAQWLQVVGASPVYGQIAINTLRHDFDSVIAPSQLWIYLNDPNYAAPVPMHMTFNTPVGAAAASQCGRVLYDDFHVEDAEAQGTNGVTFPAECVVPGMTPQEKMLEFMIFDLSSCVQPDVPHCSPQTCTEQHFTCGPQGDGCGNEIMCGTCPNGQTCNGGACGNGGCTPKTCTELKLNCGANGDGCGGLLQCGTCTNGQVCGGGGTPGVCSGTMGT